MFLAPRLVYILQSERRSWGMVREHLVFQQKSLTKGKRIWCRRRLREENLVQTQVPRILECEEQNKGLLPRVVEGLFDSINSLDIEKTYSVKLSMAMHAAPMYIAETAPTPIRGQLKSLKEFFIVLGMVVSSIIFVYLAVSTGFTYVITEFATQRRTGY
ncbi:hypothetical protein JHK86_044830 [Glycine max]|nr:hypothetical protein JHK86_044830 [Glycine max]